MDKKIIEINGAKLEINARTASVTSIESYSVGDPVKILVKQYSDTHYAHTGIIVAFDEFPTQPTITVAYMGSSSMEFASINEANKDKYQLAKMHYIDEFCISAEEVERKYLRDIESAQLSLQQKQRELDSFRKLVQRIKQKHDSEVTVN